MELVWILIELGADTNVRTPDGKGIRDVVESYGVKISTAFDKLVGFDAIA